MRTMWRFRYPFLLLAVLSCGAHTGRDADTDRMAAVLEEMLRAGSETSSDSLAARRNTILEKHGTDEAEVRAWIARIRKNPEESQEVAQQLAAALEDTTRKTTYKRD